MAENNIKDDAKTIGAGSGTGGASKSVSFSGGIADVNREFQEKSTIRLAGELNLPYINIGKTPLNSDFLKLLDFETARNSRVIPFFRIGKKVRLAVQDINKPETKDTIKFLQDQGYEIDLNLASSAGIDDALKIYEGTQQYKKIEIIENVEGKAIKTYEKEIAALSDFPKQLENVTAEEGLNLLNIGAMKTRASDIHYEPEENTVVVRFRIDGILHKVFEIKPEVYRNISNQLKYNSRMQLNVTSIPQDGRYTFIFNDKKIGVRVSSIPTPYGESLLCRFLISEVEMHNFEGLGFQGLALKKINDTCKISYGMVLCTGPTGSGKTTTLYAILEKMNTPENKVITLEDPVEYPLKGVSQSQVDEKCGYTFASGLRAILRHDPDIIMLGEIRDLETAETAVQAALTGRVVLSTLHSNSVIETIPRLRNMGLPPFMVAPALDTIIAQRLVRKVCPKCHTLRPVTESEKKEFESVIGGLKNINLGVPFNIPEKIPEVHSCEACSQTGYTGRLVLAEVITLNSEMKKLILNDSSLVDLIAAARKSGMITMREDGFIKVSQGLTTLEEVYRETNVSALS